MIWDVNKIIEDIDVKDWTVFIKHVEEECDLAGLTGLTYRNHSARILKKGEAIQVEFFSPAGLHTTHSTFPASHIEGRYHDIHPWMQQASEKIRKSNKSFYVDSESATARGYRKGEWVTISWEEVINRLIERERENE